MLLEINREAETNSDFKMEIIFNCIKSPVAFLISSKLVRSLNSVYNAIQGRVSFIYLVSNRQVIPV